MSELKHAAWLMRKVFKLFFRGYEFFSDFLPRATIFFIIIFLNEPGCFTFQVVSLLSNPGDLGSKPPGYFILLRLTKGVARTSEEALNIKKDHKYFFLVFAILF